MDRPGQTRRWGVSPMPTMAALPRSSSRAIELPHGGEFLASIPNKGTLTLTLSQRERGSTGTRRARALR
jgi:hypothetical protein